MQLVCHRGFGDVVSWGDVHFGNWEGGLSLSLGALFYNFTAEITFGTKSFFIDEHHLKTICSSVFAAVPNWLTFRFKGTKFKSVQPTCSLGLKMVLRHSLVEQPKPGRIHTAGSS